MTLKRVFRTACLVLFLATLIGLGYYYRDQIDPQLLKSQLEQLGPWAGVIFILIYAVSTVALVPGLILTITGGVIFGPVLGVVFNMLGATIGAILAFLVARYLAKEWVTKQTGPKMKVIMNGINTEGWRFVALTRLAPIVPFNALNYALGVTEISFYQYAITTVICIFPGCIAYTYLGYLGTEAALAKEGLIQKALIGLFLLVLAIYSKRLLRLIRGR